MITWVEYECLLALYAVPIVKLLPTLHMIAWTLELFTVWLETVPSSETSVIIVTGGSGAR